MRMSDWSSDVCSSDLLSNVSQCAGTAFRVAGRQAAGGRSGAGVEGRQPDGPPLHRRLRRRPALSHLPEVRLDRQTVESGQRVSVRVDLGGRSVIKHKTDYYTMRNSSDIAVSNT